MFKQPVNTFTQWMPSVQMLVLNLPLRNFRYCRRHPADLPGFAIRICTSLVGLNASPAQGKAVVDSVEISAEWRAVLQAPLLQVPNFR
jgi:hypothetical protein